MNLCDLSARYESGEEIEVEASMPHYEHAHGHVFLTPMRVVGLRDVILFPEVLQQSGVLEFPPQGSVLRCMVKKAERGPRVQRVLGIKRPGGAKRDPRIVLHGPESLSVKFFNEGKGFGFFVRPDGIDVFIHISDLKRSGINPNSLTPEARFLVEYEPSPDGFRATRVVS
jgi:CspA family cold shock protein